MPINGVACSLCTHLVISMIETEAPQMYEVHLKDGKGTLDARYSNVCLLCLTEIMEFMDNLVVVKRGS